MNFEFIKMPLQRKTTLACLLLLLIDFVVYLKTLAPAVQFIDSGELAVVCQTLGIAHPTGYPLYTLLGRLFTLLPLNDTIFRVNLFSLLSVCLANLFLFLIILKVLGCRSNVSLWTGFLTSLVFSFTPTWWGMATSNEVYGLNILSACLIIYIIQIWREKHRKMGGMNVLYILAFVYGLSFGNHMMTILLLPAIVFLLLVYEKKILFSTEKIFPCVFFFVLGLSIYLYLPIRSAQNPVLDWGNPENWPAFIRHVSGWQYKAWMFSNSLDQLFLNLNKFVKLFFNNFPLYFLPFTLLGIWRFIDKNRRFLIFLLILFLSTLFYAINYSIPDIDSYFLGCILVNVILVGSGFFFIFENLQKVKLHRFVTSGILFLFIFFPLILLSVNYFEQDRSRNHLAYDLNSNILRSAQKDGLILTQLWGHYSPWLYLRYVELKRPDLIVISRDLSFYSWYADYVQRHYPQIYKNSKDLIEEYKREVSTFENGESYNAETISMKYLDLLNGYLLRNMDSRPIYENLVGEQDVGAMLVKIPEGLVYSLKDSLEYYPYDFPNFQLRGVLDQTIYKDERTRLFLLLYSIMIQERIKYLHQFGMRDDAQALSEKYRGILQK